MNEPKPMRITEDQIHFQIIDHNSEYNLGREYFSDIRFNVSSNYPMADFEKGTDKRHLDEYMKQKHVKELDYLVYGEYRLYIQRMLHKFMCQMRRYKVDYPNINHPSEYVIPQDHVMEIERNIHNLIKELDQ